MALEELYRLLRSSHVQAQGVVDTLQEPLLVLDRNLNVLNGNPAFFCMFDVEREDTLGKNLFTLGNGQWDIPELRKLLSDVVPKARAVIGFEVDHVFPDIGQRTIQVSARRLRHPDENSSQMLLVFEDVTERQKADAAKDILLAETRHRMKNLAAILRAVATQTGIEGRTAEQFREILLGRFETVISAQFFLSANGSSSDLKALVEKILLPVAGQRAQIAPGPPVALAEHQVLPVSMILHELATNAIKYGALSTPSGLIHLSWKTNERDDTKRLLLDWREEGGSTVVPPVRTGFGTKMIKNYVAGEGGEVGLAYPPEGLRVHLSLQLAR